MTNSYVNPTRKRHPIQFYKHLIHSTIMTWTINKQCINCDITKQADGIVKNIDNVLADIQTPLETAYIMPDLVYVIQHLIKIETNTILSILKKKEEVVNKRLEHLQTLHISFLDLQIELHESTFQVTMELRSMHSKTMNWTSHIETKMEEITTDYTARFRTLEKCCTDIDHKIKTTTHP